MSLLSRMETGKSAPEDKNVISPRSMGRMISLDLVNQVHRQVLAEIEGESGAQQGHIPDEQKLKALVDEVVTAINSQRQPTLIRADQERLARQVMYEIVGFGPITPLIERDDISEIMVNGPSLVYVENAGRLELTDIVFRDNEHVLRVIDRIISPLGRRVDESMPMVDARLPDGSRVNAIIPPLALNGPVLTIRKFSNRLMAVENLLANNTLSPAMAKFLEACVRGRMNVVVAGGTGAGKTSTLNILSSFIPNDERIITIEDAAELNLKQEHVISLETRPANLEDKGEIDIRSLVRNSLRMRPDRIIVGECRGGEALDMLQAMNTGHDGSLTTAHANTPRDVIARLETMTMMAGMELPVRAIREQIASAINIIVQQARLKDGSRKITHITELVGMEGDTVVLQDIFVFRQTGVDGNGRIIGHFTPTGIRPRCLDKLTYSGIELPVGIFTPKGE